MQNAKVGGVEKTTVFITVVQTSAGGAAHPRWPVLMYAFVQIWTTPKLHILYTMAMYIHYVYTLTAYKLSTEQGATSCNTEVPEGLSNWGLMNAETVWGTHRLYTQCAT